MTMTMKHDMTVLLNTLGMQLKQTAKEAPRKELASALKITLLDVFMQCGLPEGTLLPGNVELAKFAGISHITLRKSLTALEEENVVKQVQGKGTFLTRNFSKDISLSGTVAILLPHIGGGGQYYDIVDSIGKEFTPLSTKICISSLEWAREGTFEERIGPLLEIDDLIGVVRSPSIYPEAFIEEVNYFQRFDQERAPVVFIDRSTRIKDISSVGFDDTAAMDDMFENLWQDGFRKLVFIYPDIISLNLRNAERAAGFKRAAARHQYGFDNCFYSFHIDHHNDYSTTLIKHILHGCKEDIAFVCANESVGCTVQDILKKMSPKQKTCITGFDRITGVNTQGQSFPTTVRKRTELGQCAAKMLIELIVNRNMGKRQHRYELVQPELIYHS